MREDDCKTVKGVKEAFERTAWLREPLSEGEANTATELLKGKRLVETPGSYDREKPDTLPEPMTLGDLFSAPCKHECNILKQIRHAKPAHRLLSTLNSTKQALQKAIA